MSEEEKKNKMSKAELKEFIDNCISKKFDSCNTPPGYNTCKECGTLYPDGFKCPKCAKIKGDKKDENKNKPEDEGKNKPEDEGKDKSDDEGKDKSDDEGKDKSDDENQGWVW